METIGQRIKSARQSLGMTRIELAEKLNVAERTVRGWEEGAREPNGFDMLCNIARALKCDPNYLLGFDS